MTVGTYVRQQKRDARFKFDMIRDHLESTYQLIQDQFFSKFNQRSNCSSASYQNPGEITCTFLDKSFHLDFYKKTLSLLTFSDLFLDLERNLHVLMKRRIDWTRGRFSGEIYQIIIKDGLIQEKTFLTATGRRITVRRSELGLFVKLFEG